MFCFSFMSDVVEELFSDDGNWFGTVYWYVMEMYQVKRKGVGKVGSMITQCTCHVLVCSARDPDRPSGLPMDLVCGIFHTAGSNSSNMVWHHIFLNIIADHIFNLFGDSILVSHVSLSCRNRSFIYLFIFFVIHVNVSAMLYGIECWVVHIGVREMRMLR